ncbi:MAG: hypothetical protein IIB10_13625, partial [Chloroflexi bacterium]|nr:hypothetical protein [Chloroflexota bacterium]
QQWIDKLAGGPSALQGMVDKSIALEESFKKPAGLMSGILDNFNALQDKTVTLTISRVLTGQSPGFQHGGSFIVGGEGGPDSQRVGFRASPGERVTIQPKEITNNMSLTVNTNADSEDVLGRFEMMEALLGGSF